MAAQLVAMTVDPDFPLQFVIAHTAIVPDEGGRLTDVEQL